MKRRWKLFLCLILAAVALSACSSGEQSSGNSGTAMYAEMTQYLGPTATVSPEPLYSEPVTDTTGGDTGTGGDSIFNVNPYDVDTGYSETDPLAEENYIDSGLGLDLTADAVEGTVYPYAGSTPIPLDPVDMPSPTPHPELTFTYATFTAGSLGPGLTFEAPSGWIADNSQTEVFTVTEPESQMHDGQQCIITISAVPVNSNYSESNLKSEVTQRLKDIGAVNFVKWDPSLTATRHLMGSVGVYANYTGTLANGLEIGGRIHYVCIDNVLYGVEIVFPREYREDYLNVFAQIRSTIARQNAST